MIKKDLNAIGKIFNTHLKRFSKEILNKLDLIDKRGLRVEKTVDKIDIKLDIFREEVKDLMELAKIHQKKIKYLEEQLYKTIQ